jgi:hypothetical protein
MVCCLSTNPKGWELKEIDMFKTLKAKAVFRATINGVEIHANPITGDECWCNGFCTIEEKWTLEHSSPQEALDLAKEMLQSFNALDAPEIGFNAYYRIFLPVEEETNIRVYSTDEYGQSCEGWLYTVDPRWETAFDLLIKEQNTTQIDAIPYWAQCDEDIIRYNIAYPVSVDVRTGEARYSSFDEECGRWAV